MWCAHLIWNYEKFMHKNITRPERRTIRVWPDSIVGIKPPRIAGPEKKWTFWPQARSQSGMRLLSVEAFIMSMFCPEDSVSGLGPGATTLQRFNCPIGSRLPAEKAEAALKMEFEPFILTGPIARPLFPWSWLRHFSILMVDWGHLSSQSEICQWMRNGSLSRGGSIEGQQASYE